MKKYLVAALVACLGILSVNAQVDKTIEVSQCTKTSGKDKQGTVGTYSSLFTEKCRFLH